MHEQTQIGGDQTRPIKIDREYCEWCGSTNGLIALPVRRKVKGGKGAVLDTGMHVITCGKHRDIAEASNPVRKAL